MPLIKNTYAERIVITLNEDGTLKGAHQISLERIMDDDTVLSERELAAKPVGTDDLAMIFPSEAILVSQLSTLTIEFDEIKLELESSQQESQQVKNLTKLSLIERLNNAGLFETAILALKSNELQYERWQALTKVDPNNVEIRSLITSIGGDVDELLSLE